MPYISEERKAELLNGAIEEMTGGDLAFVIATNIEAFLTVEPLSYDRITAALGALSGVAEEVRKRVLAPYEASKLMTGTDPLDGAASAADASIREAIRARVIEELGLNEEPDEPQEPLSWGGPKDGPPEPDEGADPLG